MKKIKYTFKNKESIHAKMVFGQMTLSDVLEVVCHPAYKQAWRVLIRYAEGEVSDQHFKVVEDELQTFEVTVGKVQVYEKPTMHWFKLSEKVKIHDNVVEVRTSKGINKKKTAFLTFWSDKPIGIKERLEPA